MNIDRAKDMMRSVAGNRKRWGKLGGFGEYHQDDIMEALVLVYEGGYLDFDGTDLLGMKAELTKANRQTAAANARATKFQNQVAGRDDRIKELVVALEESENVRASLELQLDQA